MGKPGRQIATENTAELRVVFRAGSDYGTTEKNSVIPCIRLP